MLCITLTHSFRMNAQGSCKTSKHRQFDFWLGRWDVFNPEGKKIGENTIHYLQDSCLIQENWIASQQTGTSYNYYDSNDDSWNQLWVDNTGTNLVLKGGYSDGKMILQSELLTSKRDKSYYRNQLVWELLADGRVLQSWHILSAEGKLLQTVFQGYYQKKK